MGNIMTNNATGGKIWEPEKEEILSKPRAKTYWLAFLTMCLIGLVASAANIISHITNKVNTINSSIQITDSVFNYMTNNADFSELSVPIGVFVFSTTALTFTLLCFWLGRPSLPEGTMVIFMLTILFGLISTIPTMGWESESQLTDKQKSWISEEMGATYRTAVDPKIEDSFDDKHADSNVYISEDNSYYHLIKEVEGDKHTLRFEQIKEPLEFERINNVLTVKN
jgi:hypothetical protein